MLKGSQMEKKERKDDSLDEQGLVFLQRHRTGLQERILGIENRI